VAGKKKRGRAGDDPEVKFRCSAEFKAWLEGFAHRERDSVSSLIDKALAAYARSRGEGEPPPRN
jgi:hypothetical protein